MVLQESALLGSMGQDVIFLSKSNEDIEKWSFTDKVKLFFNIPWSRRAQVELEDVLKHENPDIVHIHNIFPQFSISICEVLRTHGLPFVHTLHDFRLFCANAFLFRDDHVCELCPSNTPFFCLKHACFQNSYTKSVPLYLMLKRIKKALPELHPDLFIALSTFAVNKFVEFGIPKELIFIKPNFMDDVQHSNGDKRQYCAFVGRIGVEKGIKALMECVDRISNTIKLKIAGDGPLFSEMRKTIEQKDNKNAEMLGLLDSETSKELITCARFLIMPSLCYEGFPMTLVEAMAAGTPVIASRIGALEYLVSDGKTGLLFEPGNAEDLANKVKWLWDHPDECRRMGENARKEYEEKYTPEKNYKMLMDIYEKVIARHKRNK